MTPLMCACASQSNSKLSNFASVKKLVEAKAKVNIIDNNRQTPLMRAIENGKIDIAKFLIPKANLEMMDSLGRTVFFFLYLY